MWLALRWLRRVLVDDAEQSMLEYVQEALLEEAGFAPATESDAYDRPLNDVHEALGVERAHTALEEGGRLGLNSGCDIRNRAPFESASFESA